MKENDLFPKLMAILNITPDSFYDKSRRLDREAAIQRGIEMFNAGADLIDVGGESSRPGAPFVSLQEELDRTIEVIRALHQTIPIPISIDTTKPEVAEAAIEAGASMINDISGFQHPKMRSLAADTEVDICVMHMQGTPQSMQIDPQYPEGVINEIEQWFRRQIEQLLDSGVKKKHIILDPGIGFGKTVAHNLEIIQNLRRFEELGYPLLLGISRKSFMGKILKKPADELLSATLALNTVALLSGVKFIRVHDIREHRDVIELMKRYLTNSECV